jgi:hypothetical protein
MSREDDVKICLWAGHDRFCRHVIFDTLVEASVDRYTTDNAAAITLIPILQDLYHLDIQYDETGWSIELLNSDNKHLVLAGRGDSMAAAISDAVLQLIKCGVTK